MAKKGGYQMVVLATLTYALACAYLECDKPLLIYDGTNKPYYADSIEKVGDNIVIRKSGQTIVVDNENNVVNGVVASDVSTKKIYWHTIKFQRGGTAELSTFHRIQGSCIILTNSPTPITINDFVNLLKTEGFVALVLNGIVSLTGGSDMSGDFYPFLRIEYRSSADIYVVYRNSSNGESLDTMTLDASTFAYFEDLGVNAIN